ncbi:MAG TPA: metallophosphoesterase [Stellaceae bacterium]|nr:metallophosphoesterase [Stellaceae bacterium]
MTVTAPLDPLAAAEIADLLLVDDREIWAERRRAMEGQGRCLGPGGSHPAWEARVFTAAVLGFGWAMRLLGLYGRGRRNALTPRLAEHSFVFADLPAAFDGYRILHLSDTHLDCLPELAGIARRMLAGVTVDFVAVTGDIHGRPHAPVARSTLPLAELLAGPKVRDRVVAVLGNHDPAAMVEALEHFGIATLVNESLILERGAERLIVTGLDDVHRFYTPAARQALSAAPPGFRIALVHSAEIADHAAAAGFALYLCGHTHGGQICLPGGRSIFTRLRRCRFGARGRWRAGTMIGYTSNGLGVGELPLRYNCRGEIAVITLRRGPTGE